MIVITLNRVWPEVLAAAEWYEKESEGLGGGFVLAFDAAKRNIREFPFRYPVILKDVRRAQLDGFPYGVFFVIRGDESIIFAMVHMHRHPRQWQRWIPVIHPPH